MDLLSSASGSSGRSGGTGEIEVRELGPDDWEQFRRVRLAALAQAPEAFGSRYADWVDAEPERWRRRLTDVPLNVLLGPADQPIGLVSGTAPVDGVVELISLWVAPAARGRGVGEAALGVVADWARAQSARRLELSVRIANAPARRLYERCGLTVVGPSPDDPAELVMAVDLEPTDLEPAGPGRGPV